MLSAQGQKPTCRQTHLATRRCSPCPRAGAAIEGTSTFDDSVIGGPLEADDYEMRLMQDDAYLVLATTKFSVSATA
jgi:hypothetical protein